MCAFKKVLETLASEGYDFRDPIDLRTHWAKHGTNKFVTIRQIYIVGTFIETSMVSGLFDMYIFMWPFVEVYLMLCSHGTCFRALDILDPPQLSSNFPVCVLKAANFWP